MWARRIQVDGKGRLIIFNPANEATETLPLNRLYDLRIQPFPRVCMEQQPHLPLGLIGCSQTIQ
jgi:hypothetical protein